MLDMEIQHDYYYYEYLYNHIFLFIHARRKHTCVIYTLLVYILYMKSSCRTMCSIYYDIVVESKKEKNKRRKISIPIYLYVSRYGNNMTWQDQKAAKCGNRNSTKDYLSRNQNPFHYWQPISILRLSQLLLFFNSWPVLCVYNIYIHTCVII